MHLMTSVVDLLERFGAAMEWDDGEEPGPLTAPFSPVGGVGAHQVFEDAG